MKRGRGRKEGDETPNGNEGDGTPEAETKETENPKIYFLSKC